MTEREHIIEECKAALAAASISYDYTSVYDDSGCPTCGPDRVDGLTMEDISTVLDKLKQNPVRPYTPKI